MSRKREKEPYFTSVYTTPQSQTGPGKEHYYSSIHSREQQAPPPYYSSQSQAYANPSYNPPSSLGRGGRYHVGSRPAPAERAPANRQRCCLIVTVVTLVIIIVGAGIGLGVYFGAISKSDDDKASTAEPAKGTGITSTRPTTVTPVPTESQGPSQGSTATTRKSVTSAGPTSASATASSTPKPVPVAAYEVALTLNQQYSPALDDPTSATYNLYKNDIENLMDGVLRQSELRDIYIDTIVTGFSEGSVKCYNRPRFSATKVSIANQDFALDATLVATVVKTGLRKDTTTVQAYGILPDETAVKLAGLGDKFLGEECTSGNDCTVTQAQCTGWPTPRCSCVSGYFERGRRCYSKIDIEQSGCRNDSHCTNSGAICSGNKCICHETRFFDGYQCLKRNTVGSQCLGDQCARELTCINRTCQCPSGSIQHGSSCIPEPVACDDSATLLKSASTCGVNLNTNEIQSYTCRSFVAKLRCIMEDLNTKRPVFQDCDPRTIRDVINQYVPSVKTKCKEWKIDVVYTKNCDQTAGVPTDAVNDFKNNQLPVLLSNYEYEYKEASCLERGDYKFESLLWSSESYKTISQDLNNIFYANEIFNNGYLYLEESFEGVDYCTDIRTLTHLATDCIRDEPYWFADWAICAPVHSLGDCLTNRIGKYNKTYMSCIHDKTIGSLFHVDEKEKFILEARTSLENMGFPVTYGQSQWLDAISKFSLAKCPDRNDMHPCSDKEKMLRFYADCKQKTITSQFYIDGNKANFGLTPDNCRDMFNVMTCVADEFRKLKVYTVCDAEQSVYQKLRIDFDQSNTLPEDYRDLDYCHAYQPVCSSIFILGAIYRCPWPQGYHYEPLNCRSDNETKAAVDFVTCVRLQALSKHQEECTPSKIKAIIATDYRRLGVINKTADVNDCLPDKYIIAILPSREDVCTSREPIILYQDKCTFGQSQGNMNGQNVSWAQNSNRTCETTARDIANKGRVDLGCRLYLIQMNCIQVILKNMSFDCSMEQLLSAPLPPHSPLYNPNYSQPCLHIYRNDQFQLCEGQLLKTEEAFFCAAHLFWTPYVASGIGEHACMAFQESLGCYKALAVKKGINCALQWLHDFLTSTVALYQYASRPVSACHSTPDTSAFDYCQAQLPQGNLCTNSERLTVLTLGACGSIRNIYEGYYENITASPNFDQNILACRQLQFLVGCSANVTKQSGSECTQEQIKIALFTRKDIVATSLPGLNIDVCQDSCYNTEEAARKCVVPYMYIGSYQMNLCRALSYMWRCLDTHLRRSDGGPCADLLIKSVITVNTMYNFELRNSLETCQGLGEHQFDICGNLADITGLGDSVCHRYIYNMSNGDCRSGGEARKCYRDLISTFGGTCSNIDPLVESALVLNGKGSGMDITACLDTRYSNEGFCPYTYSYYCSARDLNVDACVLDSACEVGQKCCFSGCNSTCKPALEKPARWLVELVIKNETFVDDMKKKGSVPYNQFLEKYSHLIRVLIGQFYAYEVNEISRGIILSFHVWSEKEPYHKIQTALDTNFYFQTSITLGAVQRDEESRPGYCPDNWSTNPDYCSSETCDWFDIECSDPTAKCCYMSNCGGGSNSKRCINQGVSKDYGYDCKDILDRGFGSTDGVYEIKLKGSDEIVKVYCDMGTQGGGWTVFQRRVDNKTDFYRNFTDYENGFGDLERNFWLGLKNVYTLTNGIVSDLRFDMENAARDWIYELDWGFRLEDPPYYRLLINGYNISGGVWKQNGLNIGLGYYNGKPFSTHDEDRSGFDCAKPEKSHGAFWYSACSDVNPNGVYVKPGTTDLGYAGIIYNQWMRFESLKSTKMMIRRNPQ